MKKLTSLLLAVVMVLGIFGMIPLQTDAAGSGEFVEMTMEVGENATGGITSYDILWFTDSTFQYQSGDKLEYDVWISHDVAGIGGLDLCSGGLNLRDVAADDMGIGAHPLADISGYAHNQWYSRAITVPESFVGVDFSAGGPAIITGVEVGNAAALAGETVKVRYDNIRITRNGETVQAIYPGLHSSVAANPSDYVGLNNTNVSISYATTSVTVTPEPEPEVPVADGQFIEMKMEMGANATGSILSYDILWFTDNTFTYQAGDRLEYDVWMSHDLGGIGGLELCSGSLTLRDSGAIDTNGIYAHPAQDISDHAYDQWYSRSIGITDIFAGVDFSAGGPAVMAAVDVPDCAALAGQTVIIRYDNIRITRNGQTVQAIYPGLHSTVDANPTDYVGLNNPNVAISYAIATAAVEPEPEQPADRGEFIEMTMEVGANASGNVLSYDILWFTDSTFTYQPGDRLEYDVWTSHDIGGIGGLELCSGGLTLRDSGAVDANGIYAHPDFCDVSDYAYNQWYSRSIGITDIFAGVDFSAGGPAIIVPVSIPDCATLAGQTVKVRYDNIRITRNGETVQAIYPGLYSTVEANPADYVALNNAAVTISYGITTAAVEPEPEQPDDREYIETTVKIGENATSSILSYDILWFTDGAFTYQAGDRLEYDVWISHDTVGIGGLELCSGAYTLRDNGAIDSNGIYAHPDFGDISDYACNQWYSRSIGIPDVFAGVDFSAGGPAVIVPVSIGNCTALAGQTVTIRYDNIRVTRNGETVQAIYPGLYTTVEADPSDYVGLNNPNVVISYAITDGTSEPSEPTDPTDPEPTEPDESYIKAQVKVGENATGGITSYDILYFTDFNFVYQPGDKLEYDVWVSHDMGGIGGLELCSGALNLRDSAVDDKGIGAHPLADISDYAYGKWYSRAITIPDTFTGVQFEDSGPAVIVGLEIPNSAAVAGKTITLCFDNIRITRNGETVQAIYPGQQSSVPANPSDYVPMSNPNVAVEYSIGSGTMTPEQPSEPTDPTEPTDPVEPTLPKPPAADTNVLDMAIEVPAGAKGVYSNYDILYFMDYDIRFQKGDKLEYDVYLTHDMGGIGGLELCSGALNLRDSAIDEKGLGSHPATDLSDQAFGKWYQRVIPIPDRFAGVEFSGAGPAVILAAEIPDAAQAAGKTIHVYYDNIRITRNGEVIRYIYPGQNNDAPASVSSYHKHNPNNLDIKISYNQVDSISGELTKPAPGTEQKPAANPLKLSSGKTGTALAVNVEIPKGAIGLYSNYEIGYYTPHTVRFQEGDKLEYDVYLSHDIAGIGGLEFCFGYENDQILRGTAVDDLGIGAHPASDLSDQAYGKWYSRAIELPEHFLNRSYTGAGPALIFAVELADCSEIAGETVTVYYDNIRITRDGETLYKIYPDRNNAYPTNTVYYHTHNPGSLEIETTFTQVPRNDIQPLDLTPEEQEVIQFAPPKPAETQPEQQDTDIPATEPAPTPAGNSWLLPVILIAVGVCAAVVVIVILAIKKKSR